MATRTTIIERHGTAFSMTLDTALDTLLAIGDSKKFYAHETKNGEVHYYYTDVAVFDHKEYEEIKTSSKERILSEIANTKGIETTTEYEMFKPKEL